MKTERALNKLLYGLSLKAAIAAKNHYYRETMRIRCRRLIGSFAGAWDEKSRGEEYRLKVLPYWRRYRRRPRRCWFELAGSRDRKMNPRYIPSDLYYIELLPYLNNLQFRFALEDKNSLDMRFADVKRAVTVCRRMAGVFYDDKMTPIQPEDAVRLCREHEGILFIKPSLYSGFGKGIQSFDPAECTDGQIEALFEETGFNLIVQEKIRQHEVLSLFNRESVCTIRVLSLFIEGKVHITNAYLRFSVAGSSHVMTGNEYNAQILPDGSVNPMVCLDEGGWLHNGEEHLFPEDVVIPGMDRVLDMAIELHPRVGCFKWIGWDFTLDQNGDPVLIEFNTTPGDHAQQVCGNPLFGEMTDWVLEDYFFHRSMEDYQLRGVWTTNRDIRKYRE